MSEGDLIKLGKIAFLVRKIKLDINDNIKETKRKNDSNSSNCSNSMNNSNSNMNINNSLNEEGGFNINDNEINCIHLNTKLLQSIKTTNFDNQERTKLVNNKLKNLNLKLAKAKNF